ncbi:class I SAM-dependent methyltransferase [Pseudonocardia sp. HH130630-07]|uniref:class I SAM-dependent methyltransferase n=1 Tax=Pseudonocardia sp. HH130630-07 TaxID=1690815 RepID=UPI0008150E9C|nr:class I SAM-dependent methyltransferase [Pseudonocardia sp. HH130630-07]ANY05431.1 methyltransferase type 11 [Pseudonocardia sp. HH130630-07]
MSTPLEHVFLAAHEDLPREAPGSEETTALLLQLAGELPDRPRIVDIGCGTGPATLPLAAATGGTVTAVDTHEPYLQRLRGRAATAGFGDRVRTLVAPMDDLPLPDGEADVVWSDGAAYIMGFDAALAAWRRLLAPGGVLVLTEAEWTTPEPSPGAREFWDEAYPAMRTTADNVAAAQRAGYTVAATYLLPDADWAAYYRPLAARIELLREEGVDPAGLDAVGREIRVREQHGTEYGYTAFVLRPR